MTLLSEEYIMVNRVAVVAQAILIPVYFLLLSNYLGDFKVFLLENVPWLNFVFIRLIIPIVLSLPVVIFTISNAYQLADAYEEMGNQVMQLTTGFKAFYGFNFLLIVIFGLPVISPILGLYRRPSEQRHL